MKYNIKEEGKKLSLYGNPKIPPGKRNSAKLIMVAMGN